jgi:hypothetical protein
MGMIAAAVQVPRRLAKHAPIRKTVLAAGADSGESLLQHLFPPLIANPLFNTLKAI